MPPIDILASRDEFGAEKPLVKVQVKSSEGKIGDPEVSALDGKVHQDEFGLVVAWVSSRLPPRRLRPVALTSGSSMERSSSSSCSRTIRTWTRRGRPGFR